MPKDSQHYVQVHYLKAFAAPPNFKLMNYYDLVPTGGNTASQQITEPRFSLGKVSTRSICCSDDFYGKMLDDFLKARENDYKHVIDRIRLTSSIANLTISDVEKLYFYTVLMKQRNRASIETMLRRQIHMMHELKDLYAKLPQDEQVSEEIHKLTEKVCIAVTGSIVDRIIDLKLALLKAPDGCEFFTCDNPVVTTNQCFQHRVSASIGGIGRLGTQLILPINPALCLFFYDSASYRMARRKPLSLIHINESDLRLLNAVQYFNAERHLFFFSPEHKPTVFRLAEDFGKLRKKILNSQPSRIRNIIIPGHWSFCKTQKVASRRLFATRKHVLLVDAQDQASPPDF